jgi:hypothetical protein
MLASMGGLAVAQAPLDSTFTYQGELRNAGVASAGVHDLRFRLYDAAVGGTQVGGMLCSDDVPVDEGRFAVLLNFGVVFAGQERYLEIEVRQDTGLGCANPAGFVILGPRQRLTSAPNALFSLNAAAATAASNAAMLGGQLPSFFTSAANLSSGTLANARLSGTYSSALNLTSSSNVFAGSGAALVGLNASALSSGTLADARLSGNVAFLAGTQTFSGIKQFTAAPMFAAAGVPFAVNATGLVNNLNADLLDGLHAGAFLQTVPNPLTLSGNSTSHIIRGENTSSTFLASGGSGISSGAGGLTYGVYGLNASVSGTGVYGESTSPTGYTIGVQGHTSSSYGVGVFGRANATTGEPWGVGGISAGNAGVGVLGFASSSTGETFGVDGRSDSDSGTGTLGYAASLTGQTKGVHGVADSIDGVGVYGDATSETGWTYGGLFLCRSDQGFGVAASGGSFGVHGSTANSGGIAIYGVSSSVQGTGQGGYFESRASGGIGVQGRVISPSGFNTGVEGESASSDGRGVWGKASATSGLAYGGYFESSSSSGVGVRGNASASTGLNYGGYFESASTSGWGIFSWARATSGEARGVEGRSSSTSGRGVFGVSTAASGTTYGVFGESLSSSGRGVYGTGIARGVEGRTASTSGTAIFGSATATTGFAFGVYGESSSTSGRGVSGWGLASSGSTIGVEGFVNSPAGYGVRGEAPTAGWAVYATGRLGASGTKAFRIDHPDDPENKYLLHYSTESPEVINFYRGNVVLDEQGEAVVQLPHYFAKINRDPSYTLTAVGAPMPMLHVAEKINGAQLAAASVMGSGEPAPLCTFRIAGGLPGGEVSWRIEAVRNDRFVQSVGAPVEVEKPADERGTYQHPELYAQPAHKGLSRPNPGLAIETKDMPLSKRH